MLGVTPIVVRNEIRLCGVVVAGMLTGGRMLKVWNVWRSMALAGYGLGMARPSKVEPERRSRSLDGWEGCWVAVRGDDVIAAEHTSRELVAKLHEMGPQASDAVVRYVPHRSPERRFSVII